ncbi:MAG: T9SS type A sorting domain-containing protein, partial [Bacteroidetes bacterium]|nr:T9SS type A sorting domain-containing protein [Bacteroidota bacterium]
LTDSVTINVAPQVIANAGADTSICLGNTVDLIATGGSNYFWTGGFNNDTLSVTPSVSTVYGVSVTDAMGCSGTDEVAVTITYNASASAGYDTSVCRGSYVELVGIGGVSYEWSTGDLTDTIQVSPNSNTDFYITVTDATGCKGIDTINVEVLQLPLVSGGTKFICLGSTVELKTQYSTNYSYLWSTGAITNKINVSPPDTTTYYISVTNSNSCIAVDSFIVEVFFPEADAGPDVNICNGETAMLIPYNSGLYYSWSTGEWTDTIYVSPITTTTYILSVTQPNGCRATDTVVVVVDQLLTASAGPDTAVCNLDSIVLHGSGGIGFVWSTGSTNQSITVGPIAPTTYSITVTDANGCVGYADVYVGVKPKPTFSISGDSEICAGDNGEIKATSSVQFTYLWNTGSTSNKITVSPDTTTVYYVTVTNGYQCSRTDSANLIVNPLPPIPEISIFVSLGDTFLISSPAFSYQWLFYSNSIPSANYQTYAPSESGIYSVLIHDENGCMNVSDTLALYFISDEFTDAAHNWTVYPNPAESEVIVDITGISDVFVLRLTDISGQELFAETFEPSSQFRQTWDVSHLAAGVYFIRLETESGISVKKLILTR